MEKINEILVIFKSGLLGLVIGISVVLLVDFLVRIIFKVVKAGG